MCAQDPDAGYRCSTQRRRRIAYAKDSLQPLGAAAGLLAAAQNNAGWLKDKAGTAASAVAGAAGKAWQWWRRNSGL